MRAMWDLDDLIINEYSGVESLTNLCYKVICENLDAISTKGKRGHRKLKKDLILPSEICDKIILYSQQSEAIEENDYFFSIFKNVHVTKLKRVKISNCSLTDSSVLTIVSHKVTELEFNNCSNITELSIEHLNENSENLQSLVFHGCISKFRTGKIYLCLLFRRNQRSSYFHFANYFQNTKFFY